MRYWVGVGFTATILALLPLTVGRNELWTGQREELRTVSQILQAVWTGNEEIQDLKWEMDAHFFSARLPAVWLTVHCALKKPDKLRLWIASRRTHPDAWDDFQHKVGMVLILNGHLLIRYQPFFEKVLLTDLSAPLPPAQDFTYGGPGAMPNIAPYVQDLLQVASWKNDRNVRLLGRETIDGVPCYVLEWQYARPLRMHEPHAIHAVRRWIDTEKFVLRRAVMFTAQGQGVRVTTFSHLTQVKENVWASLHSETVVQPGTVRARRLMFVRRNEGSTQKETWETEVPFTGRKIVRDFQLLEGKARVPTQILVYDDEGRVLSKRTFYNYQLNTGLPDSLFEYIPFAE